MIKKLVLGTVMTVASLLSFQVGSTQAGKQAGNRTQLSLGSKADACWPTDHPEQTCACDCCDFCWAYGNACKGCN